MALEKKKRDSPKNIIRNKSFKHEVFIPLSYILCITRSMIKVSEMQATILVTHHLALWAYWKMRGLIPHICMHFLPTVSIQQRSLQYHCVAQSCWGTGLWGS